MPSLSQGDIHPLVQVTSHADPKMVVEGPVVEPAVLEEPEVTAETLVHSQD